MSAVAVIVGNERQLRHGLNFTATDGHKPTKETELNES
jgi:hypothetical protein